MFVRPFLLTTLALALAAAAGCYDPTYPQQYACSGDDRRCPEGQTCRGNVCVAGSPDGDGPVLDRGGLDLPDGATADRPARPDTTLADGPLPDRWTGEGIPPDVGLPDAPRPDATIPGGTAWVRTWGSAGLEEIESVAYLGGHVYVAGQFQGVVSVGGAKLTSVNDSGGSATSDLLVAKFTPAGQVVWAVSAGGTGADKANAVTVDGSGNVYVAGVTVGQSSFGAAGTFQDSQGGDDVFVAKLDPQGKFLWVKGGGSGITDELYDMAIDAQSNLYLVGSHSSSALFGGKKAGHYGGTDAFVVSYTKDGAVRWATHAGGSGNDVGKGIAVGPGGVYVTGYFKGVATFEKSTTPAVTLKTNNTSSSSDADAFFALITPAGTWQKAARLGGNGFDAGNRIVVPSSGSPLVTGYFRSSATYDGGTGTLTSAGTGDDDIFVAQLYKTSARVERVVTAGGPGHDQGMALGQNGAGDLLVAGAYLKTATFGSLSLTAQGSSTSPVSDLFVARLVSSSTFGFDRALSAGGTAADRAQALAGGPLQQVFVAGTFQGTGASFGPSKASSNGIHDAFLWSLEIK